MSKNLRETPYETIYSSRLKDKISKQPNTNTGAIRKNKSALNRQINPPKTNISTTGEPICVGDLGVKAGVKTVRPDSPCPIKLKIKSTEKTVYTSANQPSTPISEANTSTEGESDPSLDSDDPERTPTPTNNQKSFKGSTESLNKYRGRSHYYSISPTDLPNEFTGKRPLKMDIDEGSPSYRENSGSQLNYRTDFNPQEHENSKNPQKSRESQRGINPNIHIRLDNYTATNLEFSNISKVPSKNSKSTKNLDADNNEALKLSKSEESTMNLVQKNTNTQDDATRSRKSAPTTTENEEGSRLSALKYSQQAAEKMGSQIHSQFRSLYEEDSAQSADFYGLECNLGHYSPERAQNPSQQEDARRHEPSGSPNGAQKGAPGPSGSQKDAPNGAQVFSQKSTYTKLNNFNFGNNESGQQPITFKGVVLKESSEKPNDHFFINTNILQNQGNDNSSESNQSYITPDPKRKRVTTSEDRMDTDGFISPRKPGRFSQILKNINSKPTTNTQNRYAPLTTKEPEIETIREDTQEKEASKTTKSVENKPKTTSRQISTKKSTCPPIVLDGNSGNNHEELTAYIREIIDGKFYIKYTRDSTIINAEEISDYRKILEAVRKDVVGHHTYTAREDRTHAFVLRGLPTGVHIEDIEEELKQDYEIAVNKSFKMNTKGQPLFLITTDPAITLEYLNRNVRYLRYTRVTWELRKNARPITQCHRCQRWGHATSNCGRDPRCLKCAGQHQTYTCLKTPDTPAKCANCNGPHPANYTGCEVYLQRLDAIESRREANKPKQRFIPAPPPRTNAWSKGPPIAENNKEFPQLPVRANGMLPATTRAKGMLTTAPIQEHSNPLQGMNALAAEFGKLRSLVNLDELTRAVRELNETLSNCSNNMEAIMAFSSFAEAAGKYNIF